MKSGILIPSTIQHKSVLYGAQSYDPFFQIKAVDDDRGIIQAYASKFDNIDEYKDVVVKGAYTRTLKNQREAKRKYMYVYLFQHDPNLIIGGIQEAEEDKAGLLYQAQCNLDTQIGRETYSNAKMGVLYQSSIGYDVPSGGAEYKDGLRYLKEIRLWEISLVTFAANPEATVVGVKQSPSERPYEIQQKAVCGNTSGPIGPRDEAWDGGKAKSQIWDAAYDADSGKIDEALAKKYFMSCDGDAQQKGSYSYPFWYVGSDPHICVGAVKAVAAAIQGARGADAPSGLKSKVETLYKRVNAKYPDDPQLTPPWDVKGNAMHIQKKTLLEHYNDEMCQDLLEDWQDVFLCSLTCSILDALKIGDRPQEDISQALDDFKTLVLEKFVAQAQEVGLSQYLQDSSYSYSPADSIMQYGSESAPSYRGLMSIQRLLARKTGRSISQANADKIQAHADSVHDMATKAMNMMKEHTKALHAAADDIASMAKKPEDETPPPDENDEQDTSKKPQPSEEKPKPKAASLVQARGATPHPEASTVDEQELEAVLRRLRELREPAQTL